ncbi:hypothetical protein ACFV6B_37885 [Streptomyces microflavus]|uniref:hypothetical protein n=1 Tax=Streptomyces microflavus TaxID=1919 RepID=UPI003656EAEC
MLSATARTAEEAPALPAFALPGIMMPTATAPARATTASAVNVRLGSLWRRFGWCMVIDLDR